MTHVPQVTWISYAEVERHDRPDELPETDRRAHLVAIAESIRVQRIWVSGEKHQSNELAYVPLIDKRWAYTWSMRAWGELMANIWSVETGASYDYLSFYMSAPASPWGTPADDEAWAALSDDNPAFERALDLMKKAQERRIADARRRLLEGVDSLYATLRSARGTLSAAERVRALKLAATSTREARPISAREEEDSSHKLSARDRNIAAAVLGRYLEHEVAELGSDEDERARGRSDELFSVLLVQRYLEEAKSQRLNLAMLDAEENSRTPRRSTK